MQRARTLRRSTGMGITGVQRAIRGIASNIDVAAARTQLDDLLRIGDRAGADLLPTYGNRFQLIEGSEQFAQRLAADIRAAVHDVSITTFGLAQRAGDSPVAKPVLDALRERARAGVSTTLLVDGLIQRKSGVAALAKSLRADGVDVRFKPITMGRSGLNDAILASDHRKIVSIDGRITYQGGINLVDDWSHFHDVAFRVEGPAAAQAGALNAARWAENGGTNPAARAALLQDGLAAPVTQAREATLQLVNGNRSQRSLTEHFVERARTATQRLWIANPYLGDPKVMREVVAAAKRGVDVRLLLTPKAKSAQLQDVFTDPLRRAWAKEIRDAGGTVYEVPEFSHAKVWLIDGEAATGSFNLDKLSTRRNYENAIATTDASAVSQVHDFFQRQMARGAFVTNDAARGWDLLAFVRRVTNAQY